MWIFDMKLKTSLPVIWLKYWLKNPGWSVRNEHYKLILILVDPVDDEDWRDRPRTDPSLVSDFGTGLEVILVLKRLDFSPTSSRLLCVQSWFSVSARSIWSRLPWFRSGLCIRYRIEYVSSLVSWLVFTQHEPK
jgi:hypothetical protein